MDNNSAVQKFLRSEVSFYMTIVSAIFTVAAFYFGLSNAIQLLNQKLEFWIASAVKTEAKYELLDARVAETEKAILKLQN